MVQGIGYKVKGNFHFAGGNDNVVRQRKSCLHLGLKARLNSAQRRALGNVANTILSHCKCRLILTWAFSPLSALSVCQKSPLGDLGVFNYKPTLI